MVPWSQWPGWRRLLRLSDTYDVPEEVARGPLRRNLKLKHTHTIQGASALHDVAAVPMLRAMFDEEVDESRRLTIAGALWKPVKDPIFIECLERAKANGSLGYFGLLMLLWLDDLRAIDFLIDLLPQRDRESAPWRLLRCFAVRPPLRPLIRAFLAHAHSNQQGAFALSLLNQLEFGRRVAGDGSMWRLPSDYRRKRDDAAFRESKTAAIYRWNLEAKNGW
jgi:hypothetical protein